MNTKAYGRADTAARLVHAVPFFKPARAVV